MEMGNNASIFSYCFKTERDFHMHSREQISQECFEEGIYTGNLSSKGPFPLRAWKRLFFVCFIDFFALLSACFSFKRGKINKRNKKCSIPHSL